MKLRNRVAVITGGGSGIGRAIALRFATEGADVVPVGRTKNKLDETAAMVGQLGRRSIAIQCDITKTKQVQAMISTVVDSFGKIDILVNNAAMNRPDPPVTERVAEMPDDWWSATMGVNLNGYFLCSKYAIQDMLKRGDGAILNIASTQGLTSNPNQTAYVTSKHGEIGFTKAMAVDYGPHGIRVNAICPGITETERVAKFMNLYRNEPEWRSKIGEGRPLRRIGRPEEVAAAALFLVSDEASYVTGVSLPVDGGSMASR